MSWADRVEQVLRLIDEVAGGRRREAMTGDLAGATAAQSVPTAGEPGQGSSWAS